MWCKSLTLEKYISFRMKWFFSPPFLSVSPFLLSNLARRQCYAYSIGLYTRPEIKSWPDVKFCAHAQCVLPRCLQGHKSNGRWKVVGHRYFCDSREVFNLEMLKMICDDLVMGGRAEILKVWLYFRVWYAVGAKIVQWRYRQVPFMLKLTYTIYSYAAFSPISYPYGMLFPPEFAT